MNKFKQFEKGFAEPDRRYAVFQIIHDGAANKNLVDHYDERWFAGIVGNIPYTEGFPDDKSAWDDTEAGIREYIKRGMKVWLYDENGYPSGTAGGYITENNPEFIAKGLYCYDYWRKIYGPSKYRADVPGDKLWKAVLLPAEGGDPIDVTHCLNKNGVLYIDVPEGTYYLFMMSIRRLFDGTHATESYSEPRNYISLSDKKATEAFIACTHEKYRERLGDKFGDGILAMFTDEPSLISWHIRQGVFPILPWLDSYPEAFEKKYGYPFVNACVAVALNRGNDTVKRRCDFWEFIADTVSENYFGAIGDWCHKNGLKSSGHMLEEERLQAHVINYGSFYRSMKKFDWPGIDQLQTEPAPLMDDSIIPIARFIASFADISGEHEVFTEFSAHYVGERGEVAGPECYYSSVNWHLAMGCNNFTSYYSWKGITDKQQYDFNRYTARSGYLLRQGKRDSRVAVFYPEASMWASYTPSTVPRAIDSSEGTLALDNTFVKCSWELLHRQMDFDYIDRALLCEAEIKNGSLIYRDREYKAIVMPCVSVLETDAAEKLIKLSKAGIKVIFAEKLPTLCREDGGHKAIFDKIKKAVSDGTMLFAPKEDIGTLYDSLGSDCHTVTLSTECGNPEMLLSHSRITEDGVRIVYIANMGDALYKGKLFVNGYSEAALCDPSSGEITPIDFDGNGVCVSSESGEGKFFLFA